MKASEEALTNLIYTIVSNTCNEMIAAGMDKAKVLECANNVVKRYAETGIKMRKRPAHRAARSRDVSSTGTSKSRHKGPPTLLWITHPSNKDYQYTTSKMLATGYPLKESKSNMVVGVIDKHTCKNLTADDARLAVSLGLAVDLKNII